MSHFSSAADTSISALDGTPCLLAVLSEFWSNTPSAAWAMAGRLQGHIWQMGQKVPFVHSSFSHPLPFPFWCNTHQGGLRRHFKASLIGSSWAATEAHHRSLSLRGSVTHHVCKYRTVSSIFSLFSHQTGVPMLTTISIRIANSFSLTLK